VLASTKKLTGTAQAQILLGQLESVGGLLQDR
jgi:hypothetical protein